MTSRLFLYTLLPAKYLLSRPLAEHSHCSGVNFNVVVGKHKLNSWSEGESISVTAQVPHPSYRSSGIDNDFKLIFLSRQARGDVELVRLNANDNVPQPKDGVTVIGWGDTLQSPSQSQPSNTLKEVDVRVVSNRECRQARGYSGGFYTSYAGAITDNMLCAQAPGGDSCQGERASRFSQQSVSFSYVVLVSK